MPFSFSDTLVRDIKETPKVSNSVSRITISNIEFTSCIQRVKIGFHIITKLFCYFDFRRPCRRNLYVCFIYTDVTKFFKIIVNYRITLLSTLLLAC